MAFACLGGQVFLEFTMYLDERLVPSMRFIMLTCRAGRFWSIRTHGISIPASSHNLTPQHTMANITSVKAVFGGFPIGPGKYFPDEASIEKVYQLLEEGGCGTIDTARGYPNSEEWMGC
ncbi:hypothetical protein K438DRAFT_605668 [Mycena galopus ATCC 62051]|nr:hypothetical protein K438DRAFT_605668 [Mycena galopus ATCC 62051]